MDPAMVYNSYVRGVAYAHANKEPTHYNADLVAAAVAHAIGWDDVRRGKAIRTKAEVMAEVQRLLA